MNFYFHLYILIAFVVWLLLLLTIGIEREEAFNDTENLFCSFFWATFWPILFVVIVYLFVRNQLGITIIRFFKFTRDVLHSIPTTLMKPINLRIKQ